MKPINSKERSKQLGQFIFIFFGLAFIPVALIFFAYFKIPEQQSEADLQKLVNYSNFEHSQKLLIRKLAEIDTNINVLAANNTNQEDVLKAKIAKELADLSEDTSALIKLVQKSYSSNLGNVTRLLDNVRKNTALNTQMQDMQSKLKDCQDSKRDMQLSAKQP